MVVIDGETLAIDFGVNSTNGALAVLSDKECVVINGANNPALFVATFIALIPATIRCADILRKVMIFLHLRAIPALFCLAH